MPHSFPPQCSEPARFLLGVVGGAGAADPVKVLCRNAAVTRVSIGRFRVTVTDRTFSLGKGGYLAGWGLQSATGANVAGCTVVAENYNASAKTIDLLLYSGGTTPALRELAAGETLTFNLMFLHG